VIKNAFKQIAKGQDQINLPHLKNLFYARKHPRVVSREKTAEQVYGEFCIAIQNYVENNCVTEEGFTNYYLDTSCCLPLEKE